MVQILSLRHIAVTRPRRSAELQTSATKITHRIVEEMADVMGLGEALLGAAGMWTGMPDADDARRLYRTRLSRGGTPLRPGSIRRYQLHLGT